MKVIIKKVWRGHVSVRDYVVTQCIMAREDLEIEFNGTVKTFAWILLPTYLKNTNDVIFKSKYKSRFRNYKLTDFPWSSVEEK